MPKRCFLYCLPIWSSLWGLTWSTSLLYRGRCVVLLLLSVLFLLILRCCTPYSYSSTVYSIAYIFNVEISMRTLVRTRPCSRLRKKSFIINITSPGPLQSLFSPEYSSTKGKFACFDNLWTSANNYVRCCEIVSFFIVY